MMFEPFQKVLVRNEDMEYWSIEFFEQYAETLECPYICLTNSYKQCLPYNDETEHLLGTFDSPKEKPQPEFKFGDKVAISYNGKDWSKAVYIRKVDGDMPHEVLMQVPWHYGGQDYHVKFCRHEKW